MKMSIAVATLVGLLCPALLIAQPPEKVILRLTPQAAPRPALRYHLLPQLPERKPGNAAVYYGKVKSEQNWFFGNTELLLKADAWLVAPLDELRGNEEVEKVTGASTIYYMLEQGARCDYCDWQLPIREESLLEILLPEVQESRMFARLLTLKARKQIADGDYDGALDTLNTGFALARHVGEGPTLINALVGMAMINMYTDCLREMAQQPGAPNLYWALTDLPAPIINLRPAIETERYFLQLTFPAIAELEGSSRGTEYWREELNKVGTILEFSDSPIEHGWATAALSIRGYPLAKRALIADGMAREKVEAMPVPQVVLLHSVRQYEFLRDDFFKWFSVPYPRAVQGIIAADRQQHEANLGPETSIPIAQLLLPATAAVHAADARTQRNIEVMRTLEAIRMFAAEHDGRLPDALSELDVPLPHDPVTGQPFVYTRQAAHAVLEGPELPGAPLRYEIQINR